MLYGKDLYVEASLKLYFQIQLTTNQQTLPTMLPTEYITLDGRFSTLAAQYINITWGASQKCPNLTLRDSDFLELKCGSGIRIFLKLLRLENSSLPFCFSRWNQDMLLAFLDLDTTS